MQFNAISKNIRLLLNNLSKVVISLYLNLEKILFFNLSDESIYPQRILSVSIGSGSVGVALVSRFLGKIKLISSKKYNISQDNIPSPTDLANTVLTAIGDFKYSGKEISLTIPSTWVVFKSAVFPITVKENLRNVIAYEIDRLTPFNSEDAFFDYHVTSETDSTINVMVSAIRISLIKPYIEELKKKGITVNYLTSSISAFLSLLNYLEPKEDKIIINIDNTGFYSYSLINGEMTEHNRTMIDNSDTSILLDKLIGQINYTKTKLSNKHNLKVYIMNDTFDAIDTFKIKTTLQVKSPKDYLSKINCKEDVLLFSFGSAISSLLMKTRGYNLLSLGVKQTIQRPILSSFILSVILVLLIIAYFIIPLKKEKENLQKITSLLNSKKEKLKKAESLQKSKDSLQLEIETIEGFAQDSIVTLDIMKELTTIIPQTTWLTRIRITTKTVELEGFAENTAGLLTKLEESKYFINVEFSAPSYRDHSTKMERFTIKMQKEDRNDKEKK